MTPQTNDTQHKTVQSGSEQFQAEISGSSPHSADSFSKGQKKENNLGSDPIPALVRRLALPAMLAQFVNVLYSVIDRMYIGNIPVVGETALAGVGICGPIVTMLSAFAAWVGIGGAPLMSIKMGLQDTKNARKILANCFLMLTIMSGLLLFLCYVFKAPLLTAFGATETIFPTKNARKILANCFLMLTIMSGLLLFLCYVFKAPLLTAFGATETIFPYADTYMTVYLTGTFFSILSLGLNQFIICQGFAKLGMFSVIIGAVCNIILDPVFIFACDMGVAGAALATVLSQLASCLFTLWVLFSHRTPIGISFGNYNLRLCLKVLAVGLTPFLIILFDNILIIVQNVMLKNYGGSESDLLLTCNTIVQSFMLLVTMPLSGITGGTQSILGFNYGAGNNERIKYAEKEIVKVALIFCTILFLFAQFGSGLFVRIFTQDALYIEKTVDFIKIYTLGIIPLAVQYTIVDGMTGMGIAKVALPLSFFRKGVYIGLVVLFCIVFGAEYLFWAEPVSDVVSPIVSGAAFFILLPKVLLQSPDK